MGTVILLHGYGADAKDLSPLQEILDPDGHWSFVFPDAPLEVPISPFWTGRAWFPISLREIEAGVEMSSVRPPGLDQAKNIVKDLIFQADDGPVVLGGFSQGAMLSLQVALDEPTSVRGLILYSGVLVDGAVAKSKAAGLKGMPILQTHGRQDPVLPFRQAEVLRGFLQDAGANLEYWPFDGQHEIPVGALKRAKEMLARLHGQA
jgi:phospholipase/carboxylesterase